MTKRLRAGFDLLSFIYDGMLLVTSGSLLPESEKKLIPEIPGFCRRALVIGGGTGRFLADLMATGRVHQVDYLDISPGMIQKAKERMGRENPGAADQIRFIAGTMDALDPGDRYDLVCTNFFLDLFNEADLSALMERIHGHLLPGGYWYYTDFTLKARHPLLRLIHRFWLFLLYLSFRMITGISGRHHTPVEPFFERLGYRVFRHRLLGGGFIQAMILEKGQAPGER